MCILGCSDLITVMNVEFSPSVQTDALVNYANYKMYVLIYVLIKKMQRVKHEETTVQK